MRFRRGLPLLVFVAFLFAPAEGRLGPVLRIQEGTSSPSVLSRDRTHPAFDRQAAGTRKDSPGDPRTAPGGCSLPGSEPCLRLVSATTAVTPYVAIGDSSSAGEGVPPFDAKTAVVGRDTCHRSSRAWPLLLAGRSEGDTYNLACSGATVDEVIDGNDRRAESDRRPSQVTRLARIAGVRLVTVTIGGNDVGFASVLRRCATHLRCDRYYAAQGHDRLRSRIDALAPRLVAAYDFIRRGAPGARMVVAGYPRLFPLHPSRFTCAALSSIGPEEERYLNARTADLDAAIRNAARKASAGYVDALDAFAGHAIGCSGAQWVNHLRLAHPEYSFHPNAAGQRRLAEVVERWLQRTPSGG